MSKRNALYQAIDNYTKKEEKLEKQAEEQKIRDLIDDPELLDLFTQKNECDKLLYHAGVENNYSEIVDLLLEKMNRITNFAIHTFSHACKKGHFEVVSLLLNSNAIDEQTIKDPEYFSNACLSGNIELVKLFLEKGANPNQHEVLNSACAIGDIDIFRLLVKPDTIIGRKYFITAIEHNQEKIFQHLLDHYNLDNFIKLLPAICKTNNPKMLTRLAEKGFPITSQEDFPVNKSEYAPLTSALEQLLIEICKNDSVALLDGLITLDRDINLNIVLRCTNNEKRPLHLASFYGDVDLVERLLAYGADASLVDNQKQTPLHIACQRNKQNHIDVVDRLLNISNCATNARCKKGKTPLMLLLKNDNPSLGILDRLIAHGADCSLPDKKNNSPLLEAIKSKQTGIIDRLLDLGVNINQANYKGITPLYQAILTEQPNVINRLLDLNVEVNTFTHYRMSPLCLAITRSEETSVIGRILDVTTDINQETYEKETPLFLAIKHGKTDIINRLLDSGANVNTSNIYGETPLFIAIQNSDTTIINRLLDLGADINASTESGHTPLTMAINTKQTEVINHLLDLNAEVNNPTDYRDTPLHIAIKTKQPSVINRLLDLKANINAAGDGFNGANTPLLLAISLRQIVVANQLLDLNADVNIENNLGEKALHLAIKIGNINLINRLIDLTDDISTENGYIETPLYLAIVSRQMPIIQRLLDLNVDVNKANGYGQTPLMYAIEHRYVDIIKLLLNHPSIDLSIQDSSKNRTAADMAKSSSREIAQLLTEYEDRLMQESSSSRLSM